VRDTALPTRSFWQGVLTDPAVIGCLLAALVSLLGLLLAARALDRLRRRPPGPLTDSTGTATIEFALVLPLVLFLALTLTQTTLLTGGHVFVHYAAFAATRSAIVTIPAQDTAAGIEANVYTGPEGPKHEAIRRAAVMAVMPVSGEIADGPIPAEAVRRGLERHFQASGDTVPNWVNSLVPGRLRYADRHTKLTLQETTGNETEAFFRPIRGFYEFEPREPVTAEVRHHFALTVPWVSWIFADGEHADADGGTRFATVTARYTLTNEGIDPTLPPQPELPRDP